MVFEDDNIESRDDLEEETYENHVSKKKDKKNTRAVHITRPKPK